MKLAAGAVALVLALVGPKAQDPAVRTALKKFEDDFYRLGAKADSKIQALVALAIHKNEHVVKALSPVFSRDTAAVRIVAARELARFTMIPQAGQALACGLIGSNGGISPVTRRERAGGPPPADTRR